MKYEVATRGRHIEAIGAHSGYRIRMTTRAPSVGDSWPLRVYVRGSESEDEVEVALPHHRLTSATEAFDQGYAAATLWIDAQDKRIV
jgi:hypothetical protein